MGGVAANEEITTHLLIRSEGKADRAAVRAINTEAFEGPAEARLVDALREQANPLVSLVAEHDEEIVGHIMFSPVMLVGEPELNIMGLAPMAVVSTYQRQGMGSAPVRAGLEKCARLRFALSWCLVIRRTIPASASFPRRGGISAASTRHRRRR
jgi:predicted N-acetyltransferase YhbS